MCHWIQRSISLPVVTGVNYHANAIMPLSLYVTNMEFAECGTFMRFWVASNVSRCQQLTVVADAKHHVQQKLVLILRLFCF